MLLFSEQIYAEFVEKELVRASKFVWISTADIKSTFIRSPDSGKFVSILEIFAILVRKGVEIRLVHAKEPGPFFRKEFDRFPELMDSDRFERYLCPRNHSKCIIVDGKVGLIGSGNLTGAGIGAKSPQKRNFEVAWVSRDPAFIAQLMEFMDELVLGNFCQRCELRSVCPDPIA